MRARKDAWERWAESAGYATPRPRKRIHFNNMASLVRAAERSAGIGLIPAPLSTERFRTKTLTRLFDHELKTPDSYFLVHRAEVANRPEVIAFRQWLLSELAATIEPEAANDAPSPQDTAA